MDVRRVAVAAGIGLACLSAGINGGVASSAPIGPNPVSSDSSDDDANQRDMQQAIVMRSFLGLPTDPDTVRQISSDPKSLERLEMAVTAEESEAIDERMRLQTQITEAVRIVRESPVADDFDGVWIDQGVNASAVAVFRVTGSSDTLQRIVEPAFFGVNSFRVIRSGLTSSDLAAIHSAIDADREALQSQGIQIFGVTTDLPHELVRVEAIASPGVDVQSELQSRYGSAIVVEEPAVASTVDATDFPPLKAGHHISGLTSSCTAAFNIHYYPGNLNNDPSYGQLTAGHCGDNGQAWFEYSSNAPLGTLWGDSYDGDITTTSDAAVIRDVLPRLASNLLIQGPARQRRVTALSGYGTGFDVPNAIICDYGYKTGADCGYLEAGNFSFEAENGKTLTSQRKAINLNPCFGDSGGPVYGRSDTLATAVGITSTLFYPTGTPDGDQSISDPRCVRQVYSTYSHARHAIKDVGYEDDVRVYYLTAFRLG